MWTATWIKAESTRPKFTMPFACKKYLNFEHNQLIESLSNEIKKPFSQKD